MAKIKTKFLSRLRNNESLQFAIAQGMGRKFRTVERWIRDNDDMLTSHAVILIITKETGLSEEDIIERQKLTA